MIHLVDFEGYTPPPAFQSKRGIRLGCPLLRRGPVSPNSTVSEKIIKGVPTRHGLRASWQRVKIALLSVWGQRGRVPRPVSLYTPK